TLQADADPVRRAYLRFAVGGIGAAHVTSATLRLTVPSEQGSGSADGGTLVRLTPTPWKESRITFTLSPPVDGPEIATLGPVADGQTVSVDLTGIVTGDGIYAFALVTLSTVLVVYQSWEAGPVCPSLVLSPAGRMGKQNMNS